MKKLKEEWNIEEMAFDTNSKDINEYLLKDLESSIILEDHEHVVDLNKANALLKELLGPAMVWEENRQHLLELRKVINNE